MEEELFSHFPNYGYQSQESDAAGNDFQATEATASPKTSEGTPAVDCNRSEQVETFLRLCNAHSAVKIRKGHLWRSAGHSRARQFEYWQSCSKKATEEDERNFRRILSMDPKEFVAHLHRQNLLNTKEP